MPGRWGSCALMGASAQFYIMHPCDIWINLHIRRSLQCMIRIWLGIQSTVEANVCIVQEDEPAFLPLEQLHHSAEVTGADTCLRRPIIATASLDRSVRLWNYLTRCKIEQNDLNRLRVP